MNQNKYVDRKMTNAEAEAITGLGAELSMTMLHKVKDDGMPWADVVSAAAVACRGVAAHAMAKDPSLKLDAMREKMMFLFLQVMALPDHFVRTIDTGDDDEIRAIALPVRKH